MKPSFCLSFAASVLLFATAQAADVKSYQVTGPVTEITPYAITVQKGAEKWQIAMGNAPLPKDVKVGSKVTVQYTMTATFIEAKDAKTKK